MNKTILKKCIEELSKEDAFRKDYVLGMLETLYETVEPIRPISGTGTALIPNFSTFPHATVSNPLNSDDPAFYFANKAEAEAIATAGLIEKEFVTETNINLDQGGRRK
jgi:hypothetical protein